MQWMKKYINKTWELVSLPQGKEVIGVKWVYHKKLNRNGDVQKHKERLVAKGYSKQPGVDYNKRLVAKGYSQQHGVDYNETFAIP